MAEIDLEYEFPGARLRKIGAFDVEYAGLLKQAHRVGSLDIVTTARSAWRSGPRSSSTTACARARASSAHGTSSTTGWLRGIGPYNIDCDWGGSRVRDIGPMKLEYSRGGQTPQRVTVPDEDAELPEEHLIVRFHIRTGRHSVATGFIGFVPVMPTSQGSGGTPKGSDEASKQ